MESQNIYQQMVDWPSLYPTVDDVPKTAYTGTVNLFMLADEIYDNVPQASKLFSVLATYGTDDVIQDIPSSKLKEHPNSHALLTKDSASLLQTFREKRAKDPQYTLTSDEHKRLVALWGDDNHTQDNSKKMDGVLKKLGII